MSNIFRPSLPVKSSEPSIAVASRNRSENLLVVFGGGSDSLW